MTTLLDAVDALTIRWSVDVTDQQGKLIQRVRHKPRLSMLEDAIVTSTNKDGGGALARERDLINSRAAQMILDYKRQINTAARALDVPAGKPIPTLRAWYAATLSKVTPEEWENDWIGKLERWASEIDDLLNPPETVTVEDACPMCDNAFFEDKTDRQLKPWPLRARKWDIRQHGTEKADASCIVCGAQWDGMSAIRELATTLEERAKARHAENGVA